MVQRIALIAFAFVFGVWFHQTYLKGRPTVPVIVGTLGVAWLFSFLFRFDTVPVQIFHEVENRTDGVPA